MNQTYFNYELDGRKICFHKDNVIKVEIGKGDRGYKTHSTFEAKDFGQAVWLYNGINIGNGYKKRMICDSLNKKLLARAFS